MAMTTRRLESMSARGFLQLHKQDDGDVVITIVEDDASTRRGVMASCEFCSSGGGSRRTLEALYRLMGAMAADNLDEMQMGRRPLGLSPEEQKQIVDWVKRLGDSRKEIQLLDRGENHHAEFYAKLGELLEKYDVDLVATDDGASYGMQTGMIRVEHNQGGYRSDELLSLSADEAKALAEQIRKDPG